MNKTYENFEEWLKEHDLRKFAEWLECGGFNYNAEEAFWCRIHFDGKMFVKEIYTTNELLNLYGKEQNNG